jgi:hypothetical protein
MCQPLPYADFEWVEFSEKFTHHDLLQAVLKQKPDSARGGFVEVDIEYPEDDYELRRCHDQFPLCPEQIVCSEPSPSQRRLQESAGRKTQSGKKLVAHLMKREKYVIHTRTLGLYMRLGMKVTRVHRAVRFRQKPWMRTYVEKNTRLRQAATNGFEKDHYKMMCNALYGKNNHSCKIP